MTKNIISSQTIAPKIAFLIVTILIPAIITSLIPKHDLVTLSELLIGSVIFAAYALIHEITNAIRIEIINRNGA